MEQATTMDPHELIGGLTETQIADLKKKHGPLILLELEGKDGNIQYFFLKKPDMTIMSAVTRTTQRDAIAGSQLFFTACLVHGDAAVVNNVDSFMSLLPYLEKLIEEKTVTVKNL